MTDEFTMMGFKSYQQLPDVSWRDVGLLAVKNGIYAFGLVVIAGVFRERRLGGTEQFSRAG